MLRSILFGYLLMTILCLSQVHCQADANTAPPADSPTVDADTDEVTTVDAVTAAADKPTIAPSDDKDVTTSSSDAETTAEPATAEPTTAEPTAEPTITAEPTTIKTTTKKPLPVITMSSTEATTIEITSAEITTAEVTSAEVTSAEVTSAEATSAEVTSAEVTSAEVTSAELTNLTTSADPITEKKLVEKPTINVSVEVKEGFLVANDDGTYKGFLVDVMNKICKELNIDYKISTTGSISSGDAQLEYIESDSSKTDLTFTRELTVEMEPEAKSNFNPDLFLIFRPFTTGVWLLILLAFFLIGLSLFLFNVCHPHEHMAAAARGKSSNHDARYFHILGSYWTAFSTLMLQGYERKPRTTAGRIVLGFWFLFVIFAIVLYITSMFNIISSTHQVVEDKPEPPCNPGKNYAFTFAKDNKDLSGLDGSLETLQGNDDMLNMQKKWFDCPASSPSKRSDDYKEKVIHMQIGINSFSGAIIILVIGLIFAIIVALLEVCCHKNKHKQVPTSHTKENLLGAEEGQATNDTKEATDV